MDPLEGLRAGATHWIDSPGYELFPLNRFADRLKVVACENNPLEVGDLVIARQVDGKFAARIVTSPAPLRLAPLFSSTTSAESERAIGRVVAFERRGRSIAVEAIPWLVRAMNTLGARVRENGLRRSVKRQLQKLPYSSAAVAIRRAWLGPFEARRLTEADAAEVRRLVEAELPAMTGFILRQLRGRWKEHGIPLGAFSRRGRLCGMFYIDEYRQEGIDVDGYWLRGLIVAKLARGLGLTRLISRAAVSEAYRLGVEAVFADISPENRLVMEAMLPGYHAVPAPAHIVEALNRECLRRHLGGGWTVWQIDREAVVSGGRSGQVR